MTTIQIEASRIGVDMRLTVANLAPDARRVWAVPGVIEAMNEVFARAILAATEAERGRVADWADATADHYDAAAIVDAIEDIAPNRAAERALKGFAAAIRKATP